MRIFRKFAMAAGLAALTASPALWAQGEPAFDACEFFTKADAEAALGAPAAEVPFTTNPKVKRPKHIPSCTYTSTTKEGKAVAASATFKFAKSEPDAQKAFDEARLQFQTKPILISGAESFWSSKTGQMNLRKGRTWIAVSVGPEKLNERDYNDAKKLAEILARKM
jgi:hypothetical protein